MKLHLSYSKYRFNNVGKQHKEATSEIRKITENMITSKIKSNEF